MTKEKKATTKDKDTSEKKTQPRRLKGVVVSTKMQKTIVVAVNKFVEHPKYKKRYKVIKKYKAHDEKNETKQGDVVRIMETRPLSKDKRWVIMGVVKSN